MKKTILPQARATLVCNRNVASRDRLWAALCLASVLTTAPHPARAAVTEAWVHRYSNVVSNGYGYANAVAVDGSGNVVVTGYSWGNGNGEGYYTAKYAAANGALLWERRYDGRGGGRAIAVAVDASGNVVVTGTSGNGTNNDYYTAKYAAANGTLVWEKRYNGLANGDDQARAVKVDSSGDVVVTGISDRSEANPDFYTAKYAAADGTLIWEQRYNTPANGPDQARAVAVDGSDNVVVTGYSGFANYPDTDFYTAKYAAADGTLLWEKSYRGPAWCQVPLLPTTTLGASQNLDTLPSAFINPLL